MHIVRLTVHVQHLHFTLNDLDDGSSASDPITVDSPPLHFEHCLIVHDQCA